MKIDEHSKKLKSENTVNPTRDKKSERMYEGGKEAPVATPLSKRSLRVNKTPHGLSWRVKATLENKTLDTK